MQLKSLEICGFKSFPDRIQLQFDQGITAVVGPNGSGKSNIADAVRWVLGEQSGKTLRSGKMEDVIFAGTQQRKPMGYASVTLVIDNGDRRLPFDSDEISVSRKLYRSGESEYRLGGTSVRLRDINELFMDTGLGRDGYSIIGQGRIAEIVGAKSAQRREIFEEAAGISKYRYRKEQAEHRLTQAQENLVRLRDIMQELEGRVEPLRAQAKKAQEYLRLAERKRTLEISLWLLTIERSRELLRSQEDKLILAQNDHEALQQELSAIEAAIQAVYEDTAACSVEAERRRGEMERLASQSAAASEQKAVWNNDIAHSEDTVRRLNESVQAQEAGRGRMEEQLAARAREQAGKEAEAAAFEERAAALREELAILERRRGEMLERQSGLMQEKGTLQKKISDERLRIATSATVAEQLRQNADTLGSEARQSEAVMEELRRQKTDISGLLRSIGEELTTQQNMRKGYEMKERAAAQRVAEVQRSRDELLARQQERLQRAKLLEEMERNLEGFQQSVKFLMAQQRSGNLRGVEGPVSRLISVEAQYAQAIEVALAGAVQNVVVTTDAAAKVAIEALKKAGAGRATFLPMSVIRARTLEERGLEDCEGFVALASDLVRTEAKYEAIVRNLLGRIAVAQDLDSAIQIAKRYGYRFRVVTLDGQVVNPGGSMTGGSSARGTGILSRAGEIEQLRQQAERLEAEAGQSDRACREAEQERAALRAKLLGIESDLLTMNEDRIRYEGEQKRLEMALEEQEKRRLEGERRAEEIERRLKQLRTQSGNSDGVLRELLELESRNGEALLEAERRAGEAASEISGRREELARLERDALAAQKDADSIRQIAAQLREQLDSHTGQADELRTQIRALEERSESIRAAIAGKQQEIEASDAARAEHAAALERLAARKLELERAAAKERARERELHAKGETLARELAKLEERKGTIQSEYDAIVARLYDEYELTLSQAAQARVLIEDTHAANRELLSLKGSIKALGNINVSAIDEFRQVNERYEFLRGQISDAEHSKEELRRLIGDLTIEMRDLFLESFRQIGEHFSRIFADLFGGGNAKLLLDDPDNVLESGIEIYVQPPGKIIKNLAALSGGEQAFVAIAIYFAILKVRPSPFCLLDEIEAALDDVNVVKYAQYLRRLTNHTQFIAITHRRGTMEEADVLYGVTMQEEGVSKLLRLGVGEWEHKLGQL